VTDLAACFLGSVPVREVSVRISAIVAALHNDYGERDLGNRPDPIEELIYISLTRQTHYQNARRSWDAVLRAGGPEALADMPEKQIADMLQPGGFSRQKARWIKQSLETIRERMGALCLVGTALWSDDEVEQFLRSLPGLGIKSAKCIMLYSIGRKVLPVDTHVRRLATRIGLVRARISEQRIHRELEALVPADDRFAFHVNSIWHGRAVCTALRPRCNDCALRPHCDVGRSSQPPGLQRDAGFPA
jgi:endonuclease III